MMAERIAVRFLVAGRVQGVFFRASTRTEAERLGLQGYARNLPDGRVEVLVAGGKTSVETMAGWLRHGPPEAVVEHLERMAVEDPVLPARFEVHR